MCRACVFDALVLEGSDTVIRTRKSGNVHELFVLFLSHAVYHGETQTFYSATVIMRPISARETPLAWYSCNLCTGFQCRSTRDL